ncbi:hypothetical protein GCM10009087_52310 [Sphingomonas oligophenolica]|uniref:Peptidase n=1 Tax=Sphingomonas oligophenolica TaxID=301154 RepID=A0ABU9Y6Y0_9SPHN
MIDDMTMTPGAGTDSEPPAGDFDDAPSALNGNGPGQGDAAEETGDDFEGEGGHEVPESYQLEAPEGFAIDPEALAIATPVFRELGLSNDQASKLMPVAAQFAQGLSDKLNAQILSQVRADRKAWLDTAMADREIGGAHWKETLAKGAFALDNLGFPKGSPFRVLLDESGLGNHPEMIRAWAKVGRAIGEDGDFVRGAGTPHSRRDTAETLYPNDARRPSTA